MSSQTHVLLPALCAIGQSVSLGAASGFHPSPCQLTINEHESVTVSKNLLHKRKRKQELYQETMKDIVRIPYLVYPYTGCVKCEFRDKGMPANQLLFSLDNELVTMTKWRLGFFNYLLSFV